jgi:hypothetical protein
MGEGLVCVHRIAVERIASKLLIGGEARGMALQRAGGRWPSWDRVQEGAWHAMLEGG